MENSDSKISACLVVYNEEAIIERCLSSIKDLVDEIIIVHDGECTDNTLAIARRFTDKIYIQQYIGEAEPHRAFTFNQANGEWILQIDADEYIDQTDLAAIKEAASRKDIDGVSFKWELWDGHKAIIIEGVRKVALFRKAKFSYFGIPHDPGRVNGKVFKSDIFLRHRPKYNNIAWSSFLRKAGKWQPLYAKYFFPELVSYECFQADSQDWISYADDVKKHIFWHLFFEPLRSFLGQLKNGQWKSPFGWQFAAQHAVNSFLLYYNVRKLMGQK